MKAKKILFLYLGTENLGIEALSAYLKSMGYEVELLMDPALFSGYVLYNNKLLAKIFDSKSDNKLLSAVSRSRPDFIGFSVFTGSYKWALKWAGICKDIYPKVPVIFGGIHPTSVPEEVMTHPVVDAVVVGDGEEALEEILARTLDGGIPSDIKNTVVRRDGKIVKNEMRPYVRNLDKYPFFDKQLFYDKIPNLEECYLTMTGRGCPFRCTYCMNNVFRDIYDFETNHIRRRSVDNVIEELKIVKRRGLARKIFFGDDVFMFDKKWLEEFAVKYKKTIGMPFWCTAYPTLVDERAVELLRDAGCWLITMGVQSGSPRIRRDVFHRMESNDAIIKASDMIKRSGILLGLDNIFGAPSEKEADLIEALDLYQKIKPHRIHTFWLTYFPKAEILEKALEEGVITLEEIESLKKGNDSQFDFGGTVKHNVKLYLKYEFIYLFLSLVGYNDKARRFLVRYKYLVPTNAFVNKLLIVLNALKNMDTKFFYLMRSFFFKRRVP